MFSNCGAGEDSWESFGQQGDQFSQSRGSQPWIFIGRTDAEAEAPILSPADAKSRLILENILMLGKIEGRRRRGRRRMRWLDGITNSMDMNLNKIQEMVEDRGDWHATVHGVPKSGHDSNWSATTATAGEWQIFPSSLGLLLRSRRGVSPQEPEPYCRSVRWPVGERGFRLP